MKVIDLTKVKNVFIICGKTDMRRQIDGMAFRRIENGSTKSNKESETWVFQLI
ncbi:transposase [Carnobacterium iners]|uniref:transposase n=1 Tax=Carnobacterium iners TaxID=1073423 RepID=UPI00115FFD67|nr:transposase [Carnobacterium iners]